MRSVQKHFDQRDTRFDEIERSPNELYARAGRPGFDGGYSDHDVDERKNAIAMCEDRRSWSTQNRGATP